MFEQFSNLNKQHAFEYVCAAIFRRAEESIVGGNPAPDSEAALTYMVNLMSDWGYNTTRQLGQLEMIRQENDHMREMEGDRDD
jgi:cob(I)alamin adenosyltransferase